MHAERWVDLKLGAKAHTRIGTVGIEELEVHCVKARRQVCEGHTLERLKYPMHMKQMVVGATFRFGIWAL